MCGRRLDEVRRRTKQHSVDDPEHRGVGARAEGQRDHDGGGETRLGAQAAHRVLEVLHQGVGHAVLDGATRPMVRSHSSQPLLSSAGGGVTSK
jgi:hypothetical protein